MLVQTSTGVLQSVEGLGDLCRAHDALLIVDSVTRCVHGNEGTRVASTQLPRAVGRSQPCAPPMVPSPLPLSYSIGGVPILVDAWKIDIAYAGGQKVCLARGVFLFAGALTRCPQPCALM
jgi:aspartate aminotransferase-like enzyme